MSARKKSKSAGTIKSSPIEKVKFRYLIPPEQEQRLAILLTVGLYVIYVVWGLLSNSTWDEDCPTRYYNALAAWHDPTQFIELWNRPLFMLIFFIPVHLGKASIPILMSAISASGAYFLYKSARILNWNFAFLVIPFLLLQPFFFGVGRDAMTEPLAATLIAIGLYLALSHQWMLFVLAGALLPLARTEMAIILPIWAWVLIQNKQWKLIPLLGIGVLVWDIAGWYLTGDPLYIISRTIQGGPDENRYGHQPFNTYLSRYFYILGPTVFFFFFIGFITRIRDKQWNFLIEGQWVVGFLMYSIFAWKINLGQSAAFLRNLIPISPLTAMIALGGFNYWLQSWEGDKMTRKRSMGFILAGSALVITLLFYRNKLRIHHLITDQLDYYNVPIVAFWTLLTFVAMFFLRTSIKHKAGQIKWSYAVIIVLLAHTLITENPQANLNPERNMISDIVTAYKKLGLEQAPKTFVSHGWFYWVGGYDRNEDKFSLCKLDLVKNAPKGTVCIWENHFSNRLGSNVPIEALERDKNYALLAQYYTDNISISSSIFIKTDGEEPPETLVNNAIEKAPDIAELYIRRMELEERKGFRDQALNDLLKANELAPDNPYVLWLMASSLRAQGSYDLALGVLDDLIQGNDKNYNALILKAKVLNDMARYDEAISMYEKVLKINPNISDVYLELGKGYLQIGQNAKACRYFKNALALKSPDAQSFLDRFCN